MSIVNRLLSLFGVGRNRTRSGAGPATRFSLCPHCREWPACEDACDTRDIISCPSYEPIPAACRNCAEQCGPGGISRCTAAHCSNN